MPFISTIIASMSAGATLGAALTGALGWAGAALVQFGGSLLLSAAARALQGKPSGIGANLGVRVTTRSAIAPRDLVYGRQRKGGIILFLHKSGVSGQFLDVIIALAGHRCEAIGAVYFDGVEAVAAGSAVGAGRWAGKVTVERALGAADQRAFPQLRADLPTMWTEQHRLAGVAAIRLRLTYDGNAFPNGLPNITVDVQGKADVLDPRRGLRGWTNNAALCAADYLCDPLYGLGGVIGEDVNALSLVEAANICDEAVPLAAGGTEPRYTCNGVVDTAGAPKGNIEDLLTAMAGHAIWVSGAWHIRAGAYRAPVATWSADAARDTMKLTTRISAAENFNAVRGTFVSPENDWQPDDFPAIASAVYLAEDNGERRWLDIALPFTNSASMAQRLAKIELERARRQMTVAVPGKLRCWSVPVGEAVNFDYARWFGDGAKPFEVRSMRLQASGVQLLPQIVLRETSPLIYDWSASEEQIYAAAPRTRLPSAFDIDPPQIVSVVEGLYVTRDGDGVKALVTINLSASPSIGVVSYEVEGRRDGGDWVNLARNAGETLVEVLDIAPGQWAFRGRAVSAVGVRSGYGGEAVIGVTGLAAPPQALSGIGLRVIGGLVRLTWNQSPDLDVRIGGAIVIRHSGAAVPDWNNSVGWGVVSGSTCEAVGDLLPGAYLLRARDSSGNLGPAVVAVTSGSTAIGYSTIGLLQEEPDFTGAKSGTFATGGALYLDGAIDWDDVPDVDALPSWDFAGGIRPSGTYDFDGVLDFGTVKLIRLRSAVDVTNIDTTDSFDARFGDVDDWAEWDGSGSGESDVQIEVATTADNPAGAPVWSGWQRVQAAEFAARGVKARAILTTVDAAFVPRVSKLQILADEVA